MSCISIPIETSYTFRIFKLDFFKNPLTLDALIKPSITMNRLIFLVFFISSIITAQQIDIEKLKGLKPRAIGPAGMSGRITAIDVVNAQPDIIYAGAASGGVWKSESGGIDWKAIFDCAP
mgnify:FL=1